MRNLAKIFTAVLCALGITAVGAQTVLRDGKEVKPAQTRAPVKVAQAPAGGAAEGGTAGGAAAGGVSAGAIAAVAVGVALVAAAASGDDSEPAVTHNP